MTDGLPEHDYSTEAPQPAASKLVGWRATLAALGTSAKLLSAADNKPRRQRSESDGSSAAGLLLDR